MLLFSDFPFSLLHFLIDLSLHFLIEFHLILVILAAMVVQVELIGERFATVALKLLDDTLTTMVKVSLEIILFLKYLKAFIALQV